MRPSAAMSQQKACRREAVPIVRHRLVRCLRPTVRGPIARGLRPLQAARLPFRTAPGQTVQCQDDLRLDLPYRRGIILLPRRPVVIVITITTTR